MRRTGVPAGAPWAASSCGLLPILVSQQVRVALLLLPRPAGQAHHQLALDQPLERPVNLLEVGERVHPVAPLLELAGRLWAAEHQDGHDRLLAIVHRQRFGQEMAVLGRPAAAGQPRQAAPLEAVHRVADRFLVVVDDRVAVGRLVAGQAQRVERQRVDIRRRPPLFDQAAQNPELGRCHAGNPHRGAK